MALNPLRRKLASLRWLDRTAHSAGLLAALEGMADRDPEGAAEVWGEMVKLAGRAESRVGRLVRQVVGGSRADPAMLALVQAAGASGLVGLGNRAALQQMPGEPLAMAVEALVGLEEPQLRAAAIGVIGLLDGPSGERLVEERLGKAFVDEPEVIDAAIRTLEDLAREPEGAPSLARASMLRNALLAGLATMAHHRREEVALALVRSVGGKRQLGPAFAAGLEAISADKDHPAGTAIRRAVRRSMMPSAGAAAWRLLKHPGLARACGDRIASDENAAAAAVGMAHLAANPARAAGFSLLLNDKKGLAPALRTALGQGLDEQSRLGGVHLLGAMPVPSRELDATLGDGGGVADPAPAVRLAIVRVLGGNSARPTALLDLCFDDDWRVARSATMAVLGQCERGMVADAQRERVVATLARSPHAQVRALVAASGVSASSGASGAEFAVRTGPRDALRSQRLLEAHEMAVKSRAEDRDVVLAGIVSAIGSLGDGDSAKVLLGHAAGCDEGVEVRVRANAIDALVRRARRTAERSTLAAEVLGLLPELREAREHRVRACAARGLMVLGDAPLVERGCATLLSMLGDGRGEHRAAGLWLAERMGAAVATRPEMVDAVLRSARDSAGIPACSWHRPERALRRVESEVRAAWTLRSGPDGLGATSEAAHGDAPSAKRCEVAA